MPTSFPQYNPDTDELTPRDYYDVEEVAELLHVSTSFVHTRCRDLTWDRLKVSTRYYMSAAQIGDAIAEMQSNGHGVAEHTEPVQLGVPVADVDLEPLQ